MARPVLKVAAVQMAPVWLNSRHTWDKLAGRISEAAANGAELVVEERQLLDCSGHYARSDVIRLEISREQG